MSRCSPFEIRLSAEDRNVLEQRASSRTAAHREVVRARIVLAAAQGTANVEIAERVGVCVDVASKWRKRFCQQGLDGLKDRRRSGRPRIFGSEVVAGIKALACEPPEKRNVPLSRWSSLELAAQAVTEGLVEAISSSTVRRWLHGDAIKPWRYRSWIFPRDPDFAAKAARVLDLYARVVDGRYADATVIKLCRLRYGRSAHTWGFAIYRASHDDYQDSYLPNGMTAGSPEEALDCACGLYLNDPSAWLPNTPTN